MNDDEEVHAVISEDEEILVVTLNRPGKLNAVTPRMTSTLWDAVTELATRRDLRAMVITGTGRYFCAGIDIHDGHGDRLPGPDALALEWRYGYRSHHLLYDEIESVEKPVIVAANGPCLGAGMEMALSCDFRFSVDTATWGLPEVRSVGGIPGSGGISRLTRMVGVHWAKWVAWAGQTVSAEQAHAIGLVHEVVPADRLLDHVLRFTQSLVALGPEVSGVAKTTIDLCSGQALDAGRRIERLANTDLVHRGFGTPAADYNGPRRAPRGDDRAGPDPR